MCANALTHPLPEPLPPGQQVLAGQPIAAMAEFDLWPDVSIGLWEMTPGQVTDVESDEVFVVLSGRGTLDFDDGAPIALEPGALVRLRAGDHTTWTVTEPLRKLFISPSESE